MKRMVCHCWRFGVLPIELILHGKQYRIMFPRWSSSSLQWSQLHPILWGCIRKLPVTYHWLTTASLMEDGYLGHPGASTSTASPQIEYRPHDWQIPTTQPWAPTPNSRHLSHWLSQWKIEDRILIWKKKFKKKRKKKKNIYIYISINRHTSTLQ